MSQQDWLDKDFYAALGVPKDASQDDVRKAYRKLARENHPDANPNDPQAEERFKAISEAHGVLSDSTKRAEYDQIRQLAASGGLGGFGGFRGGGAQAGGPGVDLGDLLGNLFGQQGFGGGTRAGGPQRGGAGRRGNDLSTEVTLSFDDALEGVTVTLRLQGTAVCHVCQGVGAEPGSMPQRCDLCDGKGVVNDNQGMFSFSQPCPKCGGRGEIITNPCHNCGGSGVEQRPRTVKARIPAGVSDGATVRLPKKGEPGLAGGPPGDLFVKVRVTEHPVLRRSGANLLIDVPVTFAEAALGAKIAVPTANGSVTLKIPPGTDSGKTFRVRGKGVANGTKKGGGRSKDGDLLVTVQVHVPDELTKTQQKVVQDLADMDDSDPRAHLADLLARDGQ
ncbi:molecular chaperone DnaJ [soil metagenome]